MGNLVTIKYLAYHLCTNELTHMLVTQQVNDQMKKNQPVAQMAAIQSNFQIAPYFCVTCEGGNRPEVLFWSLQ